MTSRAQAGKPQNSPSGDTGGESGSMVPVIDRQRRYDRGIRVWGAHGQEAVEKARICLLNAGPTGAEALKNLVLGGIHSFTIVDGQKVEATDVGNNYLITAAALGGSRAKCVTECLKELNETVKGSYVEEDPAILVSTNQDFFTSFDLVIATQLPEATAIALDSLCRERGVALVLARSYGLVGYLRNCVEEHCVIESKPDNEVHDLRLGEPWPELSAAAAAVDLDALDDAEHSHVPYGLLLVKAAAAWKDTHQGQPPKSSTDRSEFKDMIRSWQRKIDDCPIPEENFTEAIASAHKVWAPPTLKSEVKAILEDEAATVITPATSDFWILAAALGHFINKEGAGQPPLEGSLPDMHATTQRYLDLQRIYKEKSEADIAAVTQHVVVLLKEMTGKDANSIPNSEIKRFCRHARQLRVVRSRPLEQGLSSDALRAGLSAEDTSSNTSLLILLRAVDKFLEQHQRFPGKYDNELEEDVALLKGLAGAILLEAGVTGVGVCDDLVGEIVRCGGGELQVIGAIVGAMASQEAIKLLTAQFVPLGGTLIYNAMHCTTSILGG